MYVYMYVMCNPIRCRRRLEGLEGNLGTKKLESILNKVTEVQRSFILSILRNALREPSGRRYSEEEQILFLSIYKKSPTAYRYFRTFLPLPAISTLKKLLQKIPMETGVNAETRKRLIEAGKQAKNDKQKTVILLWDELLLGLGLHYDHQADKVVGFEDWGNVRTSKFSDHSLVFMLRFVDSGDVIPLSFSFCNAQTTTGQLLYSIKEIVGAIKDAEFNLVATVCDGGSSNRSAINRLLRDTEKDKGKEFVYKSGCIVLYGMEIFPLYDPPHLKKCVRNNLLDKDLEFDCDLSSRSTKKQPVQRKFASWQHIIDVYEIDVYGQQNRRFLKKLTERHVYSHKIKKMRVKNALQIFSNSVAGRLEALSGAPERNTSLGKKSIPEEGKNTAWICGFFNAVADSLNGKVKIDESSDLRTLMTDTSFHLHFFKEAARKISNMHYVNPKTKKPVMHQPPSLNNLKETLLRIPLLWKKLKTLGFENLKTVHLNQDPLENFFCRIRQCGMSNHKPTCFQFFGNFKTLVINNVSKLQSEGANCIDDGSKFALSWQIYFPAISTTEITTVTAPSCTLPPEKMKFSFCKSDSIPEKGTISTGTDYILKQMYTSLISLSNCDKCKSVMEQLAFTSSNSTMKRMSKLEAIVEDVKSILSRVLSPILHSRNFVQNTVEFLKKEIDGDIFSCSPHRSETVNFFLKVSVQQYITSIISFLVLVLKGKIDYNVSSENMNEIVVKAIAKRQSSLTDNHTFSTLEKRKK